MYIPHGIIFKCIHDEFTWTRFWSLHHTFVVVSVIPIIDFKLNVCYRSSTHNEIDDELSFDNRTHFVLFYVQNWNTHRSTINYFFFSNLIFYNVIRRKNTQNKILVKPMSRQRRNVFDRLIWIKICIYHTP